MAMTPVGNNEYLNLYIKRISFQITTRLSPLPRTLEFIIKSTDRKHRSFKQFPSGVPEHLQHPAIAISASVGPYHSSP